MKIFYILFALSVLLLKESCAGRANGFEVGACVVGDSVVAELPLPSVPPTLRSVPERAAYVLEHFWDGLDFRDTLSSRNVVFMEQNFVNFLSLFPHAEPGAVAWAVQKLLKAAEADAPAYMLLGKMAEKYLYGPESPMESEVYFMLFLECMVQTPVLDEYGKTRPRYLFEVVRKNAPGTLARDFAFLTPGGKKQTLYETEGERLLLFFMDPDCAHCREMLVAMAENERIRRCVSEGRLVVWVIDVSGNRVAWRYNQQEFSGFGHVGFDTDGIREREFYVWHVLPALYLLDSNKKVLLKEPSLQALSTFLLSEQE